MEGPHLCYLHKKGMLKSAAALISVADVQYTPGPAALWSPLDRKCPSVFSVVMVPPLATGDLRRIAIGD